MQTIQKIEFNLYYIEIPKFRLAMKKDGVSRGPLEQWCAYLSEPHDPAEPLGEEFKDNEGIKEVHKMLREFTEDDIMLTVAMAHQGGLAIQNASMYLMLQEDKKDLEQDFWSHRLWF